MRCALYSMRNALCPLLFLSTLRIPTSEFYLTLTIFGSSVSRKPSPSKLNPKTAHAIARPGKIAIQGASDMKVWASFSMRPQDA